MVHRGSVNTTHILRVFDDLFIQLTNQTSFIMWCCVLWQAVAKNISEKLTFFLFQVWWQKTYILSKEQNRSRQDDLSHEILGNYIYYTMYTTMLAVINYQIKNDLEFLLVVRTWELNIIYN